jgi:uncharacterized LabA/DUF88 family protein
MSEKAVWVVDGAYMLKGGPGRVDYLSLKEELERLNGAPLFESYYLDSTPNPPSDAQDAFHTWLKCAPPQGPKMRVQLYKLKEMHVHCPQCDCRFERPVQKGVDVGIATLILRLASDDQYDRLLLSAGDGDFEDAINHVKSDLHKEIWICGFNGSVSADLQSYADEVVWLDEMWDVIRKF